MSSSYRAFVNPDVDRDRPPSPPGAALRAPLIEQIRRERDAAFAARGAAEEKRDAALEQLAILREQLRTAWVSWSASVQDQLARARLRTEALEREVRVLQDEVAARQPAAAPRRTRDATTLAGE